MVGSLTSLTRLLAIAFRMWAERINCDYLGLFGKQRCRRLYNFLGGICRAGVRWFIPDRDNGIPAWGDDVCGELENKLDAWVWARSEMRTDC
jgi:hypothetical protein